MAEYQESGLKITIYSDFSYKFDDNLYVKKFPLKKCDFFCKFMSKTQKNIPVLIEVKRINQNNKDDYTKSPEQTLKKEILRKLIESYAFIKLFDFENNEDYNLKKSYQLLNSKREFLFILVLNDFALPLRPDQISSILEILKKLTVNLKIKHQVISFSMPTLNELIEIEPL